MILSAENDRLEVIYSGSVNNPFYTATLGKHQWLPNGNLLITESTKFRAFEIDSRGKMVWEYFNLVDKKLLALIEEAQRLPISFTRAFFMERGRGCIKMN